MKQTIGVFCASHIGRNPLFQSAAQQLGRLIASDGRTLVYGGSNLGYMGTVSTAALDAGGRVVGIIPTFFSQEIIHSQPRAELELVGSMQERKSRMLELCDAFVALPGGIGTLDEISEVLMSNQLGLCRKPIGLLNIDGYFDHLVALIGHMESEELIHPGALPMLLHDSTIEGLLARLDAWDNKSRS